MKKRKKIFVAREKKRKKSFGDYPILTGSVSISGSGFGFFTIDKTSEFYEEWKNQDIFIPAKYINGASRTDC